MVALTLATKTALLIPLTVDGFVYAAENSEVVSDLRLWVVKLRDFS